MKLLIWIAIWFAVMWVVSERRRQARMTGARAAGSATPPAPQIESMVPCAHCGLHVPASEAVIAESGSFCSAEHRARHESRGRFAARQSGNDG